MNVVLLLLMIRPMALEAAAPGDPTPDESVVAGREALDHWWGGYPWYDAATDGVRRLELKARRDSSSSWDWPDWDLGGPLELLAWSMLILVLVVAVVMLIRALASGEADSEDNAAHAGDGRRIEALPFPLRKDRTDLLAEARRYYNQGDFGQAIVYLFSFQLVQLDRRQIIRLTKGKTNRQYLREVGLRQTLRALVQQTMVAFEDVFFGNHPLDRTRFESCWSRLDEFQTLVAQESP